MTHQEFDVLLSIIVDKVRQLGTTKGREYAGGEDRFGNFNRLAARMGITREQVWQVYFTKHLDSLETYIREKGAVTVTEPIQGRILDAITYLTLLYGMVEETQNTTRETEDKVHDDFHRELKRQQDRQLAAETEPQREARKASVAFRSPVNAAIVYGTKPITPNDPHSFIRGMSNDRLVPMCGYCGLPPNDSIHYNADGSAL